MSDSGSSSDVLFERQSSDSSQRAKDKAALKKERDRRYREKHKQKINERRRENRAKKSLLAGGAGAAPVPEDTDTSKPDKKALRQERNRRYRERHRAEINRRWRENRRRQQSKQHEARGARGRSMEKEKRPRVSVPQMVVSGEEFPARIRVKAEAGEGAGAVGRMVDSSQADDRKLIRLVRERRLLYARNNMPVASYYTQVKNLWDDVAATMGWSVADVRRKWSHIRNSYSRHLRNEMHGACTSKGRMVSRWYLADELEFLREHMATDISNPYTSYAPTLLEMDMNESSSSEPVDVKPFIHSPWFALNASQSPVLDHKPPSLQNDDSSSSTAFMPDENSSFFQFFRGIHSEYLELNARKQRRFKRKCLDFLHELLDEDDSNHQMQSYSHQENVLNLSNSHVSEEEKDVKPVVDVDGYILPTNG